MSFEKKRRNGNIVEGTAIKTNMADTVTDQNEVMEATSCHTINPGTVTVVRTADIHGQGGEQTNEEYILHQGFGEALTHENGQAIQIRYTTEDGVELQEADIVNTHEGPVHFVSAGTPVQAPDNQTDNSYDNSSFQVITNANSTDENVYTAEEVDESSQHEVAPIDSNDIDENSLQYINDASNQDMQIQLQDAQTVQTVTTGHEMPLLTASVAADGAPLGSSQNPIRIIQQGNQYIPVQQLSSDQMQQIMQVVQQQQLTKQSSELGSSVLFNPQTNTRIVYRVIYPSELHKDGDVTKPKEQQAVIVHAMPKRTYKKRPKEDEEEKIDVPELSKEEKELRKKMRPKTRSGRVSKPPKHMVKDFKHIHVLDYDEDYDDSDGGYSDFKQSDHEDDDESSRSSFKKDDDGSYIMPGISSHKPKKWKCVTCEKAYIGRAGLCRHLKLYPSHGRLDPDSEEMEPNSSEVTPTDSMDTPSVYMENAEGGTPGLDNLNGIGNTVNGVNSAASLSEDSRDSSSSISYTPRPRGRGLRGRPPWKGRGRGRPRGSYSMDPELRRKNKLREVVRESTIEELMEIVLPRLTKVITLWEFLLMKVEKGNPTRPHTDDVYREYLKLHDHVKRLCQEYLECVPSEEVSQTMEMDPNILRVGESAVTKALGLTAGPHRIKEISEEDSTYDYKLLTTNKNIDKDYENKSFLKRTVEVVSPRELISPPKKVKTMEDVKRSVMPVSFANKLKTLVPLSAHSAPNGSGTAMQSYHVSRPNQNTFLVNSAGEVIQSKPGIVFLNANSKRTESAVISNQITSNQVFGPGTSVDIARTNQQTRKTITVQPGTGTSLLNQSTITTGSLQPGTGTPLLKQSTVSAGSIHGQSVANPMSLLKSSVPTSASASQKVIILAESNAGGNILTVSNGGGNSDVTSLLPPPLDPARMIRQTDSKTKEIVLNSLNSLSSSYVNTQSQVHVTTSFISPQPASNIIVQTALPNTSTLLPSNFNTSLGSSESVSLLNGKVYAKSTSQQPISYIAVPVSQPVHPQLSVPVSQVVHSQLSVPGLSNHSPGSVVLQSVLNNVSLSNSIPTSTTPVTAPVSYTTSSAVTKPSTVLKNLLNSVDTNLINSQMVVEPVSASVSSMSGNSQEVNISSVNTCAQNHNIDAEQISIVTSHVSDGSVILQLNTESEQNLELPQEHQATVMKDVGDSDVDVEQTEAELEQIHNSNAALSASLTTNGETLGIIDSIDPSDTQVTHSEPLEHGDTDISMLVDADNVAPVEESETVQLESFQDGNNQEETIHIPASNIYQTEDGLIIIQNPDGTTMQLQGTDGQSIPLETIQALLAMDGETQLITEQSEDIIQQ